MVFLKLNPYIVSEVSDGVCQNTFLFYHQVGILLHLLTHLDVHLLLKLFPTHLLQVRDHVRLPVQSVRLVMLD